MNTYALTNFWSSGDNYKFTCLFQVSNIRENVFSILKVLIGNGKLVFDNSHEHTFITWNWKEYKHSLKLYRDVIEIENTYNDKVIEFEDDEAALVWYKLNY